MTFCQQWSKQCSGACRCLLPAALWKQPRQFAALRAIHRSTCRARWLRWLTRTCCGERSDRRTLRTAFREVQWRRWQLHVNGERLFVMGSNQGPSRMQLGEATPAELARDVQLALDANLDLLRLHAHVSRPELYDAADDAGLLLWQDFPLQWGYARGVRKPAVRQARAMVDVLGHHPSIVLWCAHNEPLAVDIAPGEPLTTLGGLLVHAEGERWVRVPELLGDVNRVIA